MSAKQFLCLCGVLMVCTSGALAQDWPQWRGPDRDGKAVFTAPATWPETLSQQWTTTVGEGCATPALVGEKLYVFVRQGDEEVTLCLNAADGKELWRESYQAVAVQGPAARHPGPRSSLVVADGKVVTLGVGGVLSCLDAGKGTLIWRKDPFGGAVPRFFTSSSPMIVNDMAVAQLGGSDDGGIIAYTLADGKEVWRWSEEGTEYASPALLTADGVTQVVALTNQSIVGVNAADGKLLWKRPFVPQGRSYNAATPIIDGQIVYYTGAGRGTTAVKIEKQGDGFAATELWNNPDLATQYNTPVLKNGFLFGLSDRGNLFCINAQTGKTAWTDETSRDRRGFGAIVDAGSCLMALPSSGELIIYKPDTSAFSEIKTYKVTDNAVYAFPVVSDKRIFIKDQQAVTLWTVP